MKISTCTANSKKFKTNNKTTAATYVIVGRTGANGPQELLSDRAPLQHWQARQHIARELQRGRHRGERKRHGSSAARILKDDGGFSKECRSE
jgi:hypothetical protein